MSKPVKKLITDVYRQRFGDVNEAMLINITGINANDNNDLRNGLAAKQIQITVVKNSLMRTAMEGSALTPMIDLIDGPTAVVTGGESVVHVARDLVEWARKLGNLELTGAIMDGTVFGPDQITQLSQYPTREEAQANALTLILSPARNLVGAIKSPGSKLASIVKAIQEKLEDGEEIKPAA